jgi:cell division protease FtsH
MATRREDYSEETARQIDAEIRSIIDTQYERARKVIIERRAELDRLAHALLVRETLDAEEIEAAMAGRELPKRERVIIPTYAERRNEAKEKKRAASIFGAAAPKPAPSS